MGKMKREGYATFPFHLYRFNFPTNKRGTRRIMPHA